MAKIKLGALVSDIRGSVGGMTFQNSASGLTLKVKPNMGNKRLVSQNVTYFGTVPRNNNRQILMSVIQKWWKGMSVFERENWDRFSKTHIVYEKLNRSKSLSGYQQFVKYHSYRLLVPTFAWVQVTAPFLVGLPEPVPSPEIYYAGADLRMDMNYVNGSPDFTMMVFLSKPYKYAVPYSRVKYRFSNPNVTGNIDFVLTAAYQSIWGTLPLVGEYVSAKLVLVGRFSGQYFGQSLHFIKVS